MDEKGVANRVKSSLDQGLTKEDIYKDLLSSGVSLTIIEKAFDSLQEKDTSEDTQRKTIQAVVTIAAILIGAGVFSFIAANWSDMANFAKLTIIIASMASAYVGGWRIKEKSGLIKTGEALILLGSLLYGGGIFLVAQMFHIRANWPDGFILWALGSLAMAVSADIFSLYYIGLVASAVAVVGYPVVIYSIAFGYNVANPFFLTSTLLLVISTAALFVTGMRLRKEAVNN